MRDISAYVAGKECIEIANKQFSVLLGPCVYLYMNEDDTCSYVGSSRHLMWRACFTKHDAKEARDACKSIVFIPCVSLPAARELEQKLIHDLQPTANRRGGMSEYAKELRMSNVSTTSSYLKTLKRV